MVWIALGLMAFSTALVAVNTAAGRWGMHDWRHPRRAAPHEFRQTYLTWANDLQAFTALTDRSAGGQAVSSALFGACRVVLSPTARTTDGRVLAASAFQVFSQFAVFSIFLTFLLPVWSLSFATEALGGERESQSLLWLLSRPIPRPLIYLAKFVALLPWSVGLNLLGFTLLCVAGGPPGMRALRLYWPAVAWASLAFSSLFLLVGAYFRRPAVVAIVYSFCLEVVLGNMPGYLKRVSIGFYTRCLMYEEAAAYGVQADKPSVFLPVEGTTALAVLLGGTLVLLALGMWLFSRTQYHELD
jgi:ABC-type Na+ efflux pump permease subunit